MNLDGMVDFISTPRYLTDPGAREAADLSPNTGPYRVVTTLGLLGYHTASKRMKLLATQPGVEIVEVIENTGFKLEIVDEVDQNEAPTEEELTILWNEVDKERLYI